MRVGVVVGILAGCGGAGPAPSGPLGLARNRNAPSPEPLSVFEPEPLPGQLVLWCSQPHGPACAAAQQELRASAVPTDAVPLSVLGPARDAEDDCFDPDVMPLMQRVTSAIGGSTRGWTDQEGQIVDRAQLSDLFAGPGCTNAAATEDPPTKIHIVDGPDGQEVLVRVWESGEEH